MENTDSPTIAALATPSGRSALSVIRLSGNDAHDVFARVICEAEKFQTEIARRICLYTIVDGGNDEIRRAAPVRPSTRELQRSPDINTKVIHTNIHTDTIRANVNNNNVIDEVTAIKYTAPHSFTGEDMVEIFAHGGAIIPRKILDGLFAAGAQAAGRGEFARRAFINGKMDLLKAESIIGLIDSQTERHLESAQLAYRGKQLKSLEILKRRIISVLSDMESRIEFAEDDDVVDTGTMLISANQLELLSIITDLEEDLRRSDRVRAFDDGVIVALVGPANAGKSSLFNEILGYDRSIVHDRPGTTRDAVSEKIMIDGVAIKLFDCAGIRETADPVERFGIERTLSAVKDAHFVIWVTSAVDPFELSEREEIVGNKDKVLVVINKIDLDPGSDKKLFCVDNSLPFVTASLTEKINTDDLFTAIKSYIQNIYSDTPAPEIIINERHRRIVASIIAELKDCVAHYNMEEVAAHHLKTALDYLAEFLGHTANDEVLNEIFEKFCIGK